MVVECNDALVNLVEALESAGLQVLEARGASALAAFSGDPDMTRFFEQRAAYENDSSPSGNPRFQSLFDAIDVIRPLEPSDVIDEDLAQRIAAGESGDVLIVDFSCWCTENQPDNERRHEDTKRALSHAGATVLDSTRRFTVGLSVIRAEIAASSVIDVVRTDRIARASLLPRPLLSYPEIARRTVDRLPTIQPPGPGTPLVAIIDSGVQAGHPLLSPAIFETLTVTSRLPDGGDESGHGTFVAGLALYGPLEKLLGARGTLRPAGRVLGIRVLDHQNAFPDAELWQPLVEAALSAAAERRAKVINLSIGDDRHPYHPPAPVNIAGVLDNLIQKHDLVVVVSAGNVAPGEHPSSRYARHLITSDQAGLLPPAMSALALTVGALVPDEHQGARPARESISATPLGRPGHPSPVTRAGPGIEQATKPELVAPGGTYVYDSDRNMVRADLGRGGVVSTAGGRPDALLARDIGTSFAAPLVTHAALRVLGRYPGLRGTAVRALLLASAIPTEPLFDADSEQEARAADRRLAGFGRVNAEHAELSTDHRAVLVSEETLRPDQVHFYTLRVPQAFFRRGAKSISVGLAFNPPTRVTRLKYLSSRMSLHVYRGLDVDEIRAKYAAAVEDVPDLPGRHKVDLQPSDAVRLKGANQAARADWTQPWSQEYAEIVVVVRNTYRWPYGDEPIPYGLALVLEVLEDNLPLYAELRAQLELLSEIEPELEIE